MDGVIGQIIIWAGYRLPANWMLCNGQLLDKNAYASLFNIIGFMYGRNGTDTQFALPDLDGVFIRGSGTKTPTGLRTDTKTTFINGRSQGKLVISNENLPSHSHNASFAQNTPSGSNEIEISIPVDDSAIADSPTGSQMILGRGNGTAGAPVRNYSTRAATGTLKPFRVNLPPVNGIVTTEQAGSGKPIEFNFDFKGSTDVIPPSVAMNYIICVAGYYPQIE